VIGSKEVGAGDSGSAEVRRMVKSDQVRFCLTVGLYTCNIGLALHGTLWSTWLPHFPKVKLNMIQNAAICWKSLMLLITV